MIKDAVDTIDRCCGCYGYWGLGIKNKDTYSPHNIFFIYSILFIHSILLKSQQRCTIVRIFPMFPAIFAIDAGDFFHFPASNPV